MATEPGNFSSHDEELRYQIERLLARTCMACEGQSQSLDQLLADLRKYLRGQDRAPARLKAYQEQLDQELEQLDEHRLGAGHRVRKVLGDLLALVDSRQRSRQGTRQLRELRNELSDFSPGDAALVAWLDRFVGVASTALSSPDAQGGSVGHGGFFERWFSRSPEARDERFALAETEDPCAEERIQRLGIVRRVSELMAEILDQVQLPPETYRRATLLQGRLAEDDDWGSLRRALDETAQLVIEAVAHGQREFEAFLLRLDERLLSLQEGFGVQQEAQEDRRSASAVLEQSVQAELHSLGRSVSEALDLEGLRRSVSGHLETIGDQLKQYRAQEDQREQALSDQLAAMQEKLAAMETHCEQVREKLRDERQRALTDILTGLPNREAWDDRLQFEFDRWRRYGQPLSLAVVDIDHFKRVNDSYGHRAGDKVLQLVGRVLRERLRSTDFVARYGGEEFVILLPETALEQAAAVIDDLREHISGLPFHFQGQPVSVTFSAGLSALRQGIDDVDQIFDEADKALYQAKESGRNQIQVQDPGLHS